MGFTQGVKITADVLEEIVGGFLASGVWHNVDTTWTTIDKTSDNARRVLTYGVAGGAGKGDTALAADVIAGPTAKTILVDDSANFATNDKIVIGSGNSGEVRIVTNVSAGSITFDAAINTNHLSGEPIRELDFEIYMAVEIINHANGERYGYAWTYGKGFRFVFSASWDALTHTYPTSNQSSFIPVLSHSAGIGTDLGPTPPPPASPIYPGYLLTYWLWLEENGNGFVIMLKPEPTGDNQQQSIIIVIERNPAKEYADGYTNFYLYTAGNIWPTRYDGDNHASIWRNRAILRPFAYQWPDGGGKNDGSSNGAGISFIPMPSYYAFKSTGNNKVYFVKPLIHNHAGQYNPIFQSSLFFLWSEGVGLIDGDVVSIEGTTTKFLCKALDSPDSTNRLTYGIKYVA